MSRKVNLGQIVPNIQIGTTTTGVPGSSASVENVGTTLNPILNFTIPKGEPGAIQMIIVNELPQTGQEDTIYLVPLATPESQENRYAEYVYVNNNWELLGKIGIQVDLSDYYTKQETNTLLNGKVDNSTLNDYYTKTRTDELLGGKVDKTTYNTKIQEIETSLGNKLEQSDLVGYATKQYVDNLVGDIATAIDGINREVI